MFSAVGRFERGPVEFAVGVVFERRFRTYAINRRGLTFDTRFAPAVEGVMDGVIVYLLLDGTLRWGGGREVTGPALFLMRERDFEGAGGVRDCAFRSWGTPFRSVELRIARADCSLSVGAEPPILALDDTDAPLIAAGQLYLHAIHSKKDPTVIAGLAVNYLGQLRARGILASDLAATITHDEGFRGLLWDALRPLVESFGGGAKQDDVVLRVGWSGRRVQRELTRMAVSLGVGWLGGWRDVAVRYRVRVAVLLLSSPALSVSEVANAVGYASVEAFAHALDACGLPSATEIRRALEAGPAMS
jgi:AraC-like DNA-binding protein